MRRGKSSSKITMKLATVKKATSVDVQMRFADSVGHCRSMCFSIAGPLRSGEK